jgi:hypothetical protein
VELCDLVWLLYNARNHYRSVNARLVAQYWAPNEDQDHSQVHLQVVDGGFEPKPRQPDFIVRSTVRLERPWRVSVEQEAYRRGHRVRRVEAVIIGDAVASHRVTHDDLIFVPPLPAAIEFMFDPARLLGSFDVQWDGYVEANGVRSGLVRATRREGVLRSASPVGVAAAVECRCVIDLRRGLLRAAMVRLPSSERAHFEIEEIAFDVADDLVPLEPGEGDGLVLQDGAVPRRSAQGRLAG